MLCRLGRCPMLHEPQEVHFKQEFYKNDITIYADSLFEHIPVRTRILSIAMSPENSVPLTPRKPI